MKRWASLIVLSLTLTAFTLFAPVSSAQQRRALGLHVRFDLVQIVQGTALAGGKDVGPSSPTSLPPARAVPWTIWTRSKRTCNPRARRCCAELTGANKVNAVSVRLNTMRLAHLFMSRPPLWSGNWGFVEGLRWVSEDSSRACYTRRGMQGFRFELLSGGAMGPR